MEIREAALADAESIREVHIESILGLGPEGYSEEQVEAWAAGCASADYAAGIESDGLWFVVAETNGEICGFGTLLFNPPENYAAAVDGEITGVYVHPVVTREGVGSAILSELEDRARKRDLWTLGLSASLNAVPFYEIHGYERIREHSHEFSAHESTDVTGAVVEMKTRL